MTPPPKPHRDPDSPAGFSLTELILVMAILALIATFLVPSIGRILAAQRLSAAMMDLSAQFALARQVAITTHSPVELHLYQLTNNMGRVGFTATRLFKLTNSTNNITATPYAPINRLQTGIAAVVQSNYSTLVTDTTQTNAESVPGEASSVSYRSLCFLPNGQADLTVTTPSGQPWTLTLADIRFATTGTPLNYTTLVIDPLTGKAQFYRP